MIKRIDNFNRSNKTINFNEGDVLFVLAGMLNRFENFLENFATRVIFNGIDGGEK